MSLDPMNTEGRPGPVAPHRATAILVLGILGLVMCVPMGIAAWIMGKSDLAAMEAGRMDRSGEGLTKAGYTLGLVVTVLWVVVIVGFVFITILNILLGRVPQ